MTIMQIERDGEEYTVIHYKFAISNPNARLYRKGDTYYAEIHGNHYGLGYSRIDGDPENVCKLIEESMYLQTTTKEEL